MVHIIIRTIHNTTHTTAHTVHTIDPGDDPTVFTTKYTLSWFSFARWLAEDIFVSHTFRLTSVFRTYPSLYASPSRVRIHTTPPPSTLCYSI